MNGVTGGRPHRSRLRAAGPIAVALAALAATSAVALPAGAAGTTVACGSRSESTPFARWGDAADYFAMPNGGFEHGATDWALSGGAATVAGNESYFVGSKSDTRSLRIPAGGRAESRTICVARGEDIIRLFVNNGRVRGAILHVEAIVRNPTTGKTAQTAFDVNGEAASAGWSPTMKLGIPNLLGGTGTQELTLVFTTRGTAATWNIDDVLVDPYKWK